MLSEAPFTVIVQLLLECCQEKKPSLFFEDGPCLSAPFCWLFCFIVENSYYYGLKDGPCCSSVMSSALFCQSLKH